MVKSVTNNRYIQIDDLRNDNLIKYTDDDKGTFVEPSDVIIAWDGANAGTIGYGLEGLIGSTLARLKVIIPHIDTNYLGRFLQSKFKEIRNNCTGATIPHVSKVHLNSLLVPVPPLPIQKQIAAVLEKADNLRQQSQQMEQELNSLAQSVFLDMFGDYRKDAMSLKSSLGEVADVRSGVTKGQKLEGHKLTTVPYMRVANVQDGYLDLSEIKDITVKAKDFEKYQLKAGDVLMTEGGDFDKLGRGAIWSGQIANCIHQNHVFRVRLCDRYISEFFAYYLQTPFVKQYFLKCAKKTTNLASINITQLKGLPIPDESIGKQQSFLRIIDELKALKEANFEQQEQANAHFNSLMQRAFKGELDLKDVA
ncbi:type I restriction endonuclease [Alteromonas mediterranea DE]|uniref:Type I restriction endonuclease n=1 Tax=Alteromonas mediterranea (strain DSM 17117 / CIP 110805 / LMG 28347 / Deep ecotype) TaxID=1774373 RepID=F2G4I3_ALTMD|nr:type I restriction endonuclease [Alteromonas mediterranea DE]